MDFAQIVLTRELKSLSDADLFSEWVKSNNQFHDLDLSSPMTVLKLKSHQPRGEVTHCETSWYTVHVCPAMVKEDPLTTQTTQLISNNGIGLLTPLIPKHLQPWCLFYLLVLNLTFKQGTVQPDITRLQMPSN